VIVGFDIVSLWIAVVVVSVFYVSFVIWFVSSHRLHSVSSWCLLEIHADGLLVVIVLLSD